MAVGDPVIFPVSPLGEIAIGRIDGGYERRDSDQQLAATGYPNVRRVDWLKTVPRTAFTQPALHSFGSFLTVSTSNDHLDEVIRVLTDQVVTVDAAPVMPESTIQGQTIANANLYEAATQETEDFLMKQWQKTGAAFEHVVAAVLQALGYSATVTQASGDHGVDIIAHPDALGLQSPYIKVQVKSGTGTVGEAEVNQLKGLLNPDEQGLFVSLGKFSTGAEAVGRSSATLTLIGPKQFVRLFLNHYDRLDPAWQAKFPLRRVFVPFG